MVKSRPTNGPSSAALLDAVDVRPTVRRVSSTSATLAARKLLHRGHEDERRLPPESSREVRAGMWASFPCSNRRTRQPFFQSIVERGRRRARSSRRRAAQTDGATLVGWIRRAGNWRAGAAPAWRRSSPRGRQRRALGGGHLAHRVDVRRVQGHQVLSSGRRSGRGVLRLDAALVRRRRGEQHRHDAGAARGAHHRVRLPRKSGAARAGQRSARCRRRERPSRRAEPVASRPSASRRGEQPRHSASGRPKRAMSFQPKPMGRRAPRRQPSRSSCMRP